MTAIELLETVKRSGGVLEVDGGNLKCQLPKCATHLVAPLREHKTELLIMIRSRGGRVATFPRCPGCGSHFLYREDNLGNYECMTCELREISEYFARRMQ